MISGIWGSRIVKHTRVNCGKWLSIIATLWYRTGDVGLGGSYLLGSLIRVLLVRPTFFPLKTKQYKTLSLRKEKVYLLFYREKKWQEKTCKKSSIHIFCF